MPDDNVGAITIFAFDPFPLRKQSVHNVQPRMRTDLLRMRILSCAQECMTAFYVAILNICERSPYNGGGAFIHVYLYYPDHFGAEKAIFLSHLCFCSRVGPLP